MILRTTVFLICYILSSRRSFAICPTVYGEQPCLFTPAPPGKTPSCARPGLTYCEHPSNYPMQLIEYLIKKWVYDHSTLLMDETQEEFSTYYIRPGGDHKYGYNSFHGPYPNSINEHHYPEPIHIPKPPYPASTYQNSGLSNTYIPPTYSQPNTTNGFKGYPDRRRPLPPNNQFKFTAGNSEHIPQLQPPYPSNSNLPTNTGDPQLPFLNQNDLWNSYLRNEDKHLNYTPYQRRKRSLNQEYIKRKAIRDMLVANGTTLHRHKRQTDITGQTLCQTRANYIMPRAAVNVKGNWMYVVNMPQMSDMYTQLVKSETCMNQECSGICSLPNGYTSRCEQKYVQKRLVALQEGGSQLYTDVFWFPSCCLCTITNN